MKAIFTQLVMLGIITCSVSGLAQTQEDRIKIKKKFNTTAVEKFTEDLKQFTLKQNEAVENLISQGYKREVRNESGSFVTLVGVMEDGITPLYNQIDNLDSGVATRAADLYTGGSLGLDINGEGMVAYVWDGGRVRLTHQEFTGVNKITQADDADASAGLNGQSFHATHVTGTFAANGTVNLAKGMAPQATIQAYEFGTDDVNRINTAANNGALLSNHSYGGNINTYPDWAIGAYIGSGVNYDAVMDFYGTYLHITSAGNQGNNNTANGDPLEGNSNYDKLLFRKVLKNNLVVANAANPSYDANGNVTSFTRNSSSSEGPTNDLRIKPDIAGIGTDVRSAVDSADSDYNTFSGTSMAAPTVSGTLLLLQQYYNQLNSNFMMGYSLKGLALHTAVDGLATGPDAEVGWGLINAKDAANVITNNGTTAVLEELTLQNGNTYSITVTSDGTEPLLASISWFDPGTGTPTASSTNTSTPVLLNDLDIRVTKDASTFFPWRLTGVTTNANDGDNNRDPFERVDINNPTSGTYTITVTHKGILDGGEEDYTLIVSGITSNSLSVDKFNTEDFNVYPNPTNKNINIALNELKSDKTDVIVYDIQGRILLDKQYNNTFGTLNEKLDVSHLNDGVYLLKVVNGNKTITKRIIKNSK